MMLRGRLCSGIALLAVLAELTTPAGAQQAPATPQSAIDMTVAIPPQAPPPVVDANGTVEMPAFAVPFSSYASPEAKAKFVRGIRQAAAMANASQTGEGSRRDVVQLRTMMNALAAPQLATVRQRYPYTSVKTTMGGVPVEVFTPAAAIAPENRGRVLVNLHGGGFIMGGGGPGAAIESAPVAHLGRIKVVAVDYRMAPEHRFPAASEDVAAVYRELLKNHKPGAIGIYGCSSGGQLAGQSIGWLAKEKLPRPGALGVLCSSLRAQAGGDSAHVAPRLAGGTLPDPAQRPGKIEGPYFAEASASDPLAVPAASPDLLRAFPPTLFLTGTRAPEMSAAASSQVELRRLGVNADLILFDGLGHGFHTDPDLPEAEQAQGLIARFFLDHLAR